MKPKPINFAAYRNQGKVPRKDPLWVRVPDGEDSEYNEERALIGGKAVAIFSDRTGKFGAATNHRSYKTDMND